jgi:hypothetical protein
MEKDSVYEQERDEDVPDPDEIPIRDRKLITQPYDLVVESLIKQIKGSTIFLRPLSERPNFQRRYVWSNKLASLLIESILLNVPIPPCYLSQNEDFELDVIDGQQRLFSIYRFLDNKFKLNGLEVLTELNGSQFSDIPPRLRRQLETHTLRCVLVTNESHPEIKFDVFQRLNTNTIPLNSQELRNCIYRGTLNTLLQDVAEYPPWLRIMGKKEVDKRMRDEELALRFFAFSIHGLKSYRTPQKHWLNDAAKAGRKYSKKQISDLKTLWKKAVDNSLNWFSATECFRRQGGKRSRAINRALFDLIMLSAARVSEARAKAMRAKIRQRLAKLLRSREFQDLISRAVDHTRRTKRRFALWNRAVGINLR